MKNNSSANSTPHNHNFSIETRHNQRILEELKKEAEKRTSSLKEIDAATAKFNDKMATANTLSEELLRKATTSYKTNKKMNRKKRLIIIGLCIAVVAVMTWLIITVVNQF